MDMLSKLKAKKLQRQAVENNVEALIRDVPAPSSSAVTASAAVVNGNGASASSTSLEPPAAASTSVVASSSGARPPTVAVAPAAAPAVTAPKKRVAEAPAKAGEPPVFAADAVRCPASQRELRSTVLHFICGSPSFGPLPVSVVGLNAALRREFMRAGHPRPALAIFRAPDTIEAVRCIHRDLASTGGQAVGALMLDETNSDDLLIAEADPRKIFRVLLEREQASGVDWVTSEQKRSQHNPQNHSQLVCLPYPGQTQMGMVGYSEASTSRQNGSSAGDMASVEDLLKAPTAKQRRLLDSGDNLRQLLAEPTAKQSLTASKFMNKSRNMAQFCPHGSRNDCRRAMESVAACARIHFKKIIKAWTDESLGDCSYLDTCRHIDKCKYVHYALDLTVEQAKYLNECGVHNRGTDTKRINEMELGIKDVELPAQWVQCDLRNFPLNIFNGLITVVMADPPWDIHMELPYGTLTDDEVRNLKIGDIHQDGVIFLWVTGRAMELARDCFRIWGYRRIEEIIWVKTNQLQRIIRTGRTGHWINHSKEHCLVGIKGNPRLNRNLDCDCIVSEVRETSRKPDEIYNLIERMFPNCMKLELFGRPHNVHSNWITCGNQLDGVRLCDDEIVRRYNVEYPDAKIDAWRRDKDAVVPAMSGNPGNPGGIVSEDAPWIPPRSAPPPMQSPVPNAQPQPSTSDAWVPPAAPPSGYSKDDRSSTQPSTNYPPSYPPGWPAPMPPGGPWPPHGYGAWGPYRR